ncbi:major facilitator superfamily domain-containing protein [Bisporella sp. PMI_857]|nr:major facilitator superfamily domain-containing protein [Bisporella sp. PMI_857]
MSNSNGKIKFPTSQDGNQKKKKKKKKTTFEAVYEVGWDGPSDPAFSRNFPVWWKWLIVSASSSALCVTCAGSLYTSAYKQLQRDVSCSRIMATLGLSLFLGPLSEIYGRKPIYIISMLLFTIWQVPCAVAKNVETGLISRFFGGFAGAAFLTVAGGTVEDMIKCWRWSFWTILIWSGFQVLLILFIVPETYHPVLLRNKARRMRRKTGDERWHANIDKLSRSILMTVIRSFYRPLTLLMLEPMCLSLCLFGLLGILYLFFGAFATIFKNNHGFSLYQVGLSFLGIGVGMLAAIASSNKCKNEGEGLPESEPEFRLLSAVIWAPFGTVGLFLFGWTQLSSIHLIVPVIESSLFSFGMTLVFSGGFTFLVHAYPQYAASDLAANSFSRSLFATAFPLFGIQMYNTLGYQWATTLLALLSLVMAPFPYVFYKYGKRLRHCSKFALSSH